MSDIFQRGPAGSFEFADEDALLTPADTDRFMRRLNNELGLSQLALKRAREDELDRERAFMAARSRLLLDEECPEVGRKVGQVSAKELEKWFADRIPDPYWALREAQVVRRNALDYANQVKNQVEIMRSLNVNAKAMYDTHRGGR